MSIKIFQFLFDQNPLQTLNVSAQNSIAKFGPIKIEQKSIKIKIVCTLSASPRKGGEGVTLYECSQLEILSVNVRTLLLGNGHFIFLHKKYKTN
jgi:hypothetical protein